MKEKKFTAIAKCYLEEQGYKITDPHKNIDLVPDILTMKKGEKYLFEVKSSFQRNGYLRTDQLDRCIGQCLRYLLRFQGLQKIRVIVPEGEKGLSQFKKLFEDVKTLLKNPDSLCLIEIPQKEILRIKSKLNIRQTIKSRDMHREYQKRNMLGNSLLPYTRPSCLKQCSTISTNWIIPKTGQKFVGSKNYPDGFHF